MSALGAETQTPILKRQLKFELLIVIALLCLPTIYGGAADYLGYSLNSTNYGSLSGFPSLEIYRILTYAGAVAILLYLIWSGGETWKEFGLSRIKPSDVGWSIPVLLGLWALPFLLRPVSQEVRNIVGPHVPEQLHTTLPLWLSPLYFIIAALFEELLFRSYIYTRLKQLGFNAFLAIAISSCLFTPGHAYQGLPALVSIFGMGLLFGFVFHFSKRIWIGVVGHACFNTIIFFSYYHWLHTHFTRGLNGG